MNIAIQGHPIRGKEIIQIFETLGGKVLYHLDVSNCHLDFFIDGKGRIACVYHNSDALKEKHTIYTLEEFEEKFPFKVGDKVITKDGTIGIIDRFKPEDAYPYCIEIDGGYCYWCSVSILKSYKEMERNVTLTLEKAKEWYNKGGELKEIALQAYSEKELNPLPRSWEEFCKNGNPIGAWRYTIPQKYEAFYKLEQLRNCWWNDWEPEWNTWHKYSIKNLQGELTVLGCSNVACFLAFPTREMAEEFLKCFRDLIEQARDLI